MSDLGSVAPSGAGDAPDLSRRQLLNLLTFGTVSGVAVGALYPVARFFAPPRARAGFGGVLARDESGTPSAQPDGLQPITMVIEPLCRVSRVTPPT